MKNSLVLDAERRAVESERHRNEALKAAGFTVTDSKVTERITRDALKAAGFYVPDKAETD